MITINIEIIKKINFHARRLGYDLDSLLLDILEKEIDSYIIEIASHILSVSLSFDDNDCDINKMKKLINISYNKYYLVKL